MLTPPEMGVITDPRRNQDSSKVDSSSHLIGQTIFTANGAGTTTTLVGATAANGTNAVRPGERGIVYRAGVPLDDGKVVTISGVATGASDTVTFSPALAEATANGDVLKTVTPVAYVDNDSLDERLIALGFTQAYVDSLSQNDKVYQIRLSDDAGGFKP
jgi:hypothetical protein